MASDLSARRRSLGNTRQPSASIIWKIGIPLLCGLAFLIFLSRRQVTSTGFVQSTTKAQVQVSNCTQAASAQANISCNCPPTPNVTDGASHRWGAALGEQGQLYNSGEHLRRSKLE